MVISGNSEGGGAKWGVIKTVVQLIFRGLKYFTAVVRKNGTQL